MEEYVEGAVYTDEEGTDFIYSKGDFIPVEANRDPDVPVVDPNADYTSTSTATPPQGYLETAINQLTSGQLPGNGPLDSAPALMGAFPAQVASGISASVADLAGTGTGLIARNAATRQAVADEALYGAYTNIGTKTGKAAGAVKDLAKGTLHDKIQTLGAGSAGIGAVTYALDKIGELFGD